MFKNENDFKNIINRLNIDDKPNADHRQNLHRQMLSTFNKTTKPRTTSRHTLRTITKLAAAVIIITITLGILKFGWTIDATTVAWAEVIEKIKNINDIHAESWRKFTVLGKDKPLFEGKVLKYFSRDLGYVEEQYIDGRCVLRGCGFFPKKLGVIILPDLKKYIEFELNEKILLLVQKLNPLDPTGMTEMFDRIEYQRLDFRKIDGIVTDGFEVKLSELRKNEISDNFLLKRLLPMENLTVRFWIDVETSLPVEIEAEGLIGKGFLTGFKNVIASEFVHNIEWGTKVNPKIFEPNIPHDYNLIPDEWLEDDTEY